jgi:magnesium chelatase subunit D
MMLNTPARSVAALLARDGAMFGGAVIEGDAEEWLTGFRALTPSHIPFMRIPASASDERLFGALDLAATLAAGMPVMDQGLVASAAGGYIILHGAERLDQARAARLAGAIDEHHLTLIALEDRRSDDEGLPAVLAERLTFRIAGDRFDAPPASRQDATCPDDLAFGICEAALALGIQSVRHGMSAIAAARGLAAFAGRREVNDDDAAEACKLVLAHRAQQMPEAEPPAEETQQDQSENAQTESVTIEAKDMLLDAVRPALPHHLLDTLQTGAGRKASGRGADGKAKSKRGRPAGSRRGQPERGLKLDLIATLRAAAPWQGYRKRGAARDGVIVSRDDFRIKRLKQRSETTAIFAVDASGSAALHRLAEAKGAVELILADCYVRRDKAALISFRSKAAELLLPPTRSLERARRALAALPGGGGTPLAAGLDQCLAIAMQVKRSGGRPIAVVLTDGRANVTRDGQGNRPRATEEALGAARLFAQHDVEAMLIDVSPQPQASARQIAEAMDAVYLPMPRAGAQAIAVPVAAALKQA